MRRYRYEIDNVRAHLRSLWAVIGVQALIIFALWFGWSQAPKTLTVHVPPDLRSGAVLAIDQVRIRSRSLNATAQRPSAKSTVVSAPSRTTTRVESVPASSCQTIAVYSPGGTPAMRKRPGAAGRG